MPQITEQAKNKIIDLIDKQHLSIDNILLRIVASGGGCNDIMKKLSFVEKEKINEEQDMIFEFDKVKLVIDHKSLLYFVDAKIDYRDTLMGAGFIVEIEGAHSCGCGESFNM